MYKLLVFCSKILFKIFYTVDVDKKIKLDENQGYMICSNHIHMFDPVFISCFTNRQIHYMGKKELFKRKFSNWIFTKVGAFPVDREKPDLNSIRTAVGKLKDKCVLGIFPEGTRSKTGKMGEFKSGAGLIALKGNVPIVPVKIEGNYKLFSKMKLKIGETIYYTGKDRDELTELIKTAIASM